MIRQLAASIRGQLEATSVLNGKTYEGVVESRPQAYVTFFLNSGVGRPYRFTDRQSQRRVTVTVHSVGVTAEQCQLFAEKAFAQLDGFRPVVTGFESRRMTHEVSRPMNLDTAVQPSMHFIVDQFDVILTPIG